jgi:hypothetical protein
MGDKFLNSVIELLVSGTKIDYNEDKVIFPFNTFNGYDITSFKLIVSSVFFYSPLSYSDSISFTSYCKDVYGLTHEETKYVWKEYIIELRIMLYGR